MSKSIGPGVEFKCSFDCELGGCPGHVLCEIFDRSTDIYTIEIDKKSVYYFDEPRMSALLKAHELGKGM